MTAMVDSDGDGDGDGDVLDGQQRRYWTATATAMMRMSNDVNGGRQWRP